MTHPNASERDSARWYARLIGFNVEELFSRKKAAGPSRTIFVNEHLPSDYLNNKGKAKREHVYTSNQVITSKYTLITFLPRNLLEQFRRIANMFFLAIAILQIFPKFKNISAGAVILPLAVILVITGLKDGYEDFKRHQSDRRVNNSKVRVLSGGGYVNANATEPRSKSLLEILTPARMKSVLTGRTPVSDSALPEVDYGDDENTTETSTRLHWKQENWEDVRVGDFVKLRNNESLPADILICATSEEESIAFVETMNLDGETNLKSRHAVPVLSDLRDARACADRHSKFQIQCEQPDMDMYRLNANVKLGKEVSPVDLSMTLLRGTVLRNTDWVIGIVLFTGYDSKIVMNSGGTPSKRSKVERQMNPQVIVNLVLLAIMATVCAIADSVLERRFFPLGAPWLFMDDESGDNPQINGVITWAFALLTFQDIVPISLYISIEFVKTCQAAFIYFDPDIYYEKTKQATMARSWNLSDDLGQIEYIFSDKTGTLTQNLMVFRGCSIGGKAYRGDPESTEELPDTIPGIPTDQNKETILDNKFKDVILSNDLRKQDASPRHNFTSSTHQDVLYSFFTVLGLCHTVLATVNSETGAIEYRAQSPDEAALVRAASDMGFAFLGKDKELLSLRTPSSQDADKYELLDILEFTSARKRMSVVVRKVGDGDGRLLLLTKGADNVIFERLRQGEDALKAVTEDHLREFANSGLRTLTLAYRAITEEEYRHWSARYEEATIALDNKDQRVETICNELEQDLQLLGATAIEDRLQDGVPETIADLKKAGIKIWVATGDKMETAIAIGRSTNLIRPDSNIIVLRGGSRSVHSQMADALAKFFPEHNMMTVESLPSPATSGMEPIPLRRIDTGFSSIVGPENGDRPGGFILVVDGAALLEAFADAENKTLLLRLATICEGVICCRVSPLQKALVVHLVKDGLHAMTLAIGDGANDVSMIQAADVGVGISGEEGLQAVNSSDYSIAQFRFLKKLLLVHGHWSYARNGVMILNFFYKNIVPIGVLWWFQIYDGWSANYVFDYTYILFWNSLWTIAPVIGVGLFDRFLDAHVLMQVPELYRYGREGTWFGLRSFTIYMLHGILQSALIYFLILYTYLSPTARKDGYDVYLYEFSSTMAISAVLVANIFTGLNATAWTWWLVFAVFIGIIVQWFFTIVYSLISPGYSVTLLYGNDHFLFTSAYFWLCLPLTVLIALAPRTLAKAWKFGFNPGDLETFQLLQNKYPNHDLSRFSTLIQRSSSRLAGIQRQSSITSIQSSRTSNIAPVERHFVTRPPLDLPPASQTDMSTGISSVDHGFGFATEEHGVEMRRVQTNLSERRSSRLNLVPEQSISNKAKDRVSNAFSLSRATGFLRRKIPPSQPSE